MNISNDLRKAVRGRVLGPDDAGFDAARQPWNTAVEQPVTAVVDASDAADVATVVNRARLSGLGVATQPSGHGASGDVDGVILLRTGGLDRVEIRPAERIARVEAGVRWGDVLAAASPHGLIGLAGSSPVVSVVGYTLGGGLSWFGRRHGLAANSVRAFDVVTADGEQARVDAAAQPELFWALRGGGGDFAVVTAVEFDLHQAPRLYGGRMMWPATRAEDVLNVFRELTAQAPDELSVWFELIQFPAIPQLPEPLRGLAAVVVDATYLGEPAAGEHLMRPFDKIEGRILDSRKLLPVAELGSITAEPTEPAPGVSRAHLLTRVDDDVAATFLDAATASESGSVAPLVTAQIRHLGGALARPGPDAGAAGRIEEDYLLYLFGSAYTADQAAAVRRRQGAISDALAPYTSGRTPFTLLAPPQSAAGAFPANVLARLRDIKRANDPLNVIRSNYPVLGGQR